MSNRKLNSRPWFSAMFMLKAPTGGCNYSLLYNDYSTNARTMTDNGKNSKFQLFNKNIL